ncbi:MAG: carboxypeptidase-like regulatory domain-containing protein, partial [Bacteroidales bacterium]|nr:carboxypeptidase-like regulatory domain-containing protein [Bacteroidales bacterium]
MRNSPKSGRQQFVRIFLLILSFSPLGLLAAQQQVTLRGESMTMKQAIEQIEKNSDYTFFYTASDLKEAVRKNINVKGPIDEVLRELFSGSRVNYVVKGNEVILSVQKAEAQSQAQQQKRTIKGKVIDGDTKEPIIGANIWLKNSSTITITGVGGVLEFSYIGMKKQEIAIGNQTTIDITLSPDAETLEEVVVVGYGSQKKESVVGAISTLEVGKLIIPGASISTALAGQLSGIVAVTRSGEPGKSGAADFYIRGVSSFKGTSKPLVLV